MKQSLVQYMFVELKRAFPKEIGKMYNNNPELLESVFQKAREKEKEVIINAFISGDNSDCLQEQDSRLFAEQYYNKTFNTKEK